MFRGTLKKGGNSTIIVCFLRKVLEVGVLIWSVATALLPFLAGCIPGLVLSRVLVCSASPLVLVLKFQSKLLTPFHEFAAFY